MAFLTGTMFYIGGGDYAMSAHALLRNQNPGLSYDVDYLNDVSVVHLDDYGFEPLKLSCRELNDGEVLTVAGFPMTDNLQSYEVTTGAVLYAEGNLIISDMVVRVGFSGAPALDKDGMVVGVVYAKNDVTHETYLTSSCAIINLLEKDYATKQRNS